MLKEKLIELVRNETILYDVSHPDYSKKTLKDSIWLRISKELILLSGGEAKSMWLKLRNCHRDAIRRKVTKSGSGASILKPWKYEQQMQFLLNYMSNRPTSGNLTLEQEEPAEQEEDVAEEVVHDDSGNDVVNTELEDETIEENSANLAVKNASASKHKTKTATINVLLITTLQQHQDRAIVRGQKSNDTNKHDEMYHFFMSMLNTVKKMPHSNQIRLKRKIFNIVCEEEESLSSNIASYFAPSTSGSSNSHTRESPCITPSGRASLSPTFGLQVPQTVTNFVPVHQGHSLFDMNSYMPN